MTRNRRRGAPAATPFTALRKRFNPAAMGLASLSIFGAEGGAHAAQPAAPEQTLPEVRVQDSQNKSFRTDTTRAGTRTDTPLRDIPQFINTVPQTLIRSQNATSLTDALRNVPGISYGAAEGGTQANQVFFLRGFPLNADIFVDGVRDLGEYNRDLFATESIEVLKGSSALMFGRGSPGGLINQTTKVADRLERREVALTVGSFDQKRATFDLNLRTGSDSALRLIGLGEKGGNFRYPQDTERYGFAPSFWMNLGKATDMTLSYYYLKSKEVTDYGQPTRFAGGAFLGFPQVSAKNYYGYANHDFADYETHIATFRLEHQFSEALSLRNTLRWASYQRESESTISTLRGTDANGAAVTASTPLSLLVVTRNHDSGRTRDNDDTALINQTELTWKVSTGSVKHTVLAGLELARERLDRTNYILDADPATAGTQAPTSTTSFLNPDPSTRLSYSKTPNLNALADGDTAAVYVQDQIELTPHWKALVGLRYEHFKADARTVQLSAVSGAATGPFGRTDNMLSGRAGIIWQPTTTQSYYVSYGNSYSPSGELGVYGGTGTNLSAANQALDPEKNQNYEIGAQWDVLRGLQLRSAIFRNEKINARMADATGTTILAGKRRVDGIEFEATGSITPNWDIYSGIAFMDGEIVTGPAAVQGNKPLGVADVAGNVWSVYRLGGGWEVGGGVRMQKGTYVTDANQAGSAIPTFFVWDATLAYVQKKYEVRLNVYNLGDKIYYIGGYANNPNRVLPGQPRAASVTVRYNF
ncbi:MAG TPA: TonB-dependent siderophore receptor [Burkholderiales bacterium]|nr:TonB-dependent siderophore receptor [Burkholderiales bacterium]